MSNGQYSNFPPAASAPDVTVGKEMTTVLMYNPPVGFGICFLFPSFAVDVTVTDEPRESVVQLGLPVNAAGSHPSVLNRRLRPAEVVVAPSS